MNPAQQQFFCFMAPSHCGRSHLPSSLRFVQQQGSTCCNCRGQNHEPRSVKKAISYQFLISTLALLLSAILMTTGCSKRNPTSTSDPGSPDVKAASPRPVEFTTSNPGSPGLVEFNVGADRLRQGMNQQQVEAALGKPEEISNSGNSWIYRKRGVFVLFGKNGEIVSIKFFPTFAVVIADGVSIGSTKAEAVAAFGNPSRESPYGAEGVVSTFRRPGLRIEINFWKDKVTEFVVYFVK